MKEYGIENEETMEITEEQKHQAVSMNLVMLMSKPIEINRHYICPDEFVLRSPDKEVHFGFGTYFWDVDKNHPSVISCTFQELSENKGILPILDREFLVSAEALTECRVDTAGGQDSSISPVSILACSFGMGDGEVISLNRKTLENTCF